MAANRSFASNYPMFSRYAQCARSYACVALNHRRSLKQRWHRIRSHITKRALGFKKW